MTLGIGAVLVVRKGNVKAIHYLWAFASRRYAPMPGMRTVPGMSAIVHQVAGWNHHGGLHATDGRGCRRRRLVSFMNHCRGVCNQELERTLGISVITTEFVELLVGESLAESIRANICTIYRVLRLLLIFDPKLKSTSAHCHGRVHCTHTFEKISSLINAASLKPVMSTV
jgi:hypothetical protein